MNIARALDSMGLVMRVRPILTIRSDDMTVRMAGMNSYRHDVDMRKGTQQQR